MSLSLDSLEINSHSTDAALKEELKTLFRRILSQFQYSKIGNTVLEYPLGTVSNTHRFGTNVFQIFNPSTPSVHCLYTTFKVADEDYSGQDLGYLYLEYRQSDGHVISYPAPIIIKNRFTLTETDIRQLWDQL